MPGTDTNMPKREKIPTKIDSEKPQGEEIKTKEESLRAKVFLLLIGLIDRIKDKKYRQEILDELVELEMAEAEAEKKSPPHHGTKLGVDEIYRLFESKKCPEDFKELASNADRYLSETEYEDFEIAFENLIFGLSIEKRKELARKRKGKILEEYFINYLVRSKKK